MYYLGIDGGGTKTAFTLVDKKGNILATTEKGSTHYIQVGKKIVQTTLERGIMEICREAGIEKNEITYSFLGLPCYGEQEISIPLLEGIASKVLPGENFTCGNDVEAGWAGSLACRPGVHLVAGTGAIGFACDFSGQTARSSGWGFFLGDEGSAYWLGRMLLSVFSKQSDGRLEKTPLYEIVRNHFELDRDLDIIDIVYDQLGKKRDEIARLALLVFEAAKREDSMAVDLYRQAAHEHSLTVRALIERLDFEGKEIPVSYSGGVFKAGKYILEPLNKQISGLNVNLIRPRLQPVTGAALYALKKDRGDVDQNVIENLQTQE